MKKKKYIKYPPILLFAYNRPNHFKRTFTSLGKNYNAKKYKLIIFIDGPKTETDKKKADKIESLIKGNHKFKSINIFKNKTNRGLKKSIINGVNYVFKKFENVIVLEDDIVTNKHYLEFMTNSLNYYKNNSLIGSISGYSYINMDSDLKDEIYLSQRHASWGWGTWKKNWVGLKWNNEWAKKHLLKENFKLLFNSAGEDMYHMLNLQIQKKIDSWAIIYNLNQFLKKKYCLCPSKSLLFNIGMDGSGIHCKKNDTVFSNYEPNFYVKNFSSVNINQNILDKICKSFHTPIYKRIINKIFNKS